MNELKSAINNQAADALVMRLLLTAVIRQIPNKSRLIKDFTEMAEDSEVRTIFSSRPEEFFEAFQESRKCWDGIISDSQRHDQPKS